MSASANEHLTGFLLARLDEDETGVCDCGDFEGHEGDCALFSGSGRRIVAECEAKRQIVGDFRRWDLLAKSGDMAAMGTAAGLRDACLRLAAIHKDHPDFDEVWLP